MNPLVRYEADEHPINLALSALPFHFEGDVPVFKCPAGVAENAFYLRDRGMGGLQVEITCWPNHKTQVHTLTTGGVEPKHLRINAYEKWLNVIVDARMKYADKLHMTEQLMCEVLDITILDLRGMVDRWYKRSEELSALDNEPAGPAAAMARRERMDRFKPRIQDAIRAGRTDQEIAEDFNLNQVTIRSVHNRMDVLAKRAAGEYVMVRKTKKKKTRKSLDAYPIEQKEQQNEAQ